MTYERQRFRDNRAVVPYGILVEGYERVGGCTSPIIWYKLGSSSGAATNGTYASMSDCVVPNYHRYSNRGRTFFNPMSKSEKTINVGSGITVSELEATAQACSAPYNYFPRRRHTLSGIHVGRLLSGFRFDLSGSTLIPDKSAVTAADRSALITEVSTSCLNQIGREDSNLWETLAEADQILGTLASLLKSLSVVMPSASNRVKTVAGAYLGWRYGLKPVLSDVENVARSLSKLTGKLRRTYRARGSLSSTSTTVTSGMPYMAAYYGTGTWTTRSSLTVRAMSLHEYYADVLSNAGFTLRGLLTLPWELIPYSFVLDWFINLGDYIGSLVPEGTASQLGSCLVIEETTDVDFTYQATSATGGYRLVTAPSGACSSHCVTKSREPGALRSGIVIKSDFRFSNLTRCLDALGLVVQKLH